ncbi:hypothetical protein SteCoe_3265 [Stentor coeruleus]|uniref:WWE domain-containing protein n=1 Tax=Stentor coeruleus TaxID=5963 RepID=A0A1R2CXL4_9CILI|nr:hypothetical protein SteCoe_3265 [Stentor coeruleus]
MDPSLTQTTYDQNKGTINPINLPNKQDLKIGSMGMGPPLSATSSLSSVHLNIHGNMLNQPSGPGAQMKMPMFPSNVPMPNPGMPMPNLGMPIPGMPMQNLGMPMQNLGMPMQNLGMPMPNPGMPMPNKGMPMPNPGLAMSNPGTPIMSMPNLGMPMPNPGMPMSNPGMPMPISGMPMPNPGMPMPNPGMPMPNPGMPMPNPRPMPGPGLPNTMGTNISVKMPPVPERPISELPLPGNPMAPSMPPVPRLPNANNGFTPNPFMNPPQISNLPMPSGPMGNPMNLPQMSNLPMPSGPMGNPMNRPQMPNPPFSHNSQFNPNISISSSEPSIIVRAPLSTDSINQSINSGHMQNIQNSFPQASLSLNNAGPNQQYVLIIGPQSQVTNSYNHLKSIDPHSDSQWYFLSEDGHFLPYESNLNQIIENAFINGQRLIEFSRNSSSYILNFGENGVPHSQINQDGYIHRLVRRGKEALNQGYDIKWYWTDDKASQWKIYEPEACHLIEYYYQEFLSRNSCSNFGQMDDRVRKENAKKLSVLVSGTSGFSYMMDFINMVQLNEQTGRWRGVRRGEAGGVLRISKFGAKDDPIPWIQHPILN